MRLLAWSMSEAGLEVVVTRPEAIESTLLDFRPDVVLLNQALIGDVRAHVFAAIHDRAPEAMVLDLASPTLRTPQDPRPDAYVAPPYSAAAIVERIQALLEKRKRRGKS
jgi:hypothetical protein